MFGRGPSRTIYIIYILFIFIATKPRPKEAPQNSARVQQAGSLAEMRVRKTTEARQARVIARSSQEVGTNLGGIEPGENRGTVMGFRKMKMPKKKRLLLQNFPLFQIPKFSDYFGAIVEVLKRSNRHFVRLTVGILSDGSYLRIWKVVFGSTPVC